MSATPLRTSARLFLHRNLERAPGVGRFRGRRELDLAVFGHVLALGAVAPARRRRALRGIESSAAAELCEMRAAGVGRNARRVNGLRWAPSVCGIFSRSIQS